MPYYSNADAQIALGGSGPSGSYTKLAEQDLRDETPRTISGNTFTLDTGATGRQNTTGSGVTFDATNGLKLDGVSQRRVEFDLDTFDDGSPLDLRSYSHVVILFEGIGFGGSSGTGDFFLFAGNFPTVDTETSNSSGGVHLDNRIQPRLYYNGSAASGGLYTYSSVSGSGDLTRVALFIRGASVQTKWDDTAITASAPVPDSLDIQGPGHGVQMSGAESSVWLNDGRDIIKFWGNTTQLPSIMRISIWVPTSEV